MNHRDYDAHQELDKRTPGRHSPVLGGRHRQYGPVTGASSRKTWGDVAKDFTLTLVIAVALAAVLFYGLSS